MSEPSLAPPVLVTGASGFVGSALARRLCADGQRVRVLLRPTSDRRALAGLDVEIALGALEDADSLIAAARGCATVFHCAAAVGDWGSAAHYARVNVDGTRQLLAACHGAGVRRLVYCSSLTVLGLPRDGRVLDEGSPYTPRPRGVYTASKIAAERLAAAATELEVVIVRPGAIWGPGDPTLLPRFVALGQRGRLFWIGDGSNRLGLSYIDHVVEVLQRAGSRAGLAGQIVHVTDAVPISSRQLVTTLAAALALAPPRRGIPVALLELSAGLAELWARTRGATPTLSRYGVELLACDARYPGDRAATLLDFSPAVDFEAGVSALAAWYRESGPRA